MLVAFNLLTDPNLKEEVEGVWEYISSKQVRVFLEKSPESFSIKVDWIDKGMGYVLYARELDDGVVMGLRLKGSGDEIAILYLGELRGVCWALEDTKKLVQIQPLMLWINSESVYQRITQKSTDPKKCGLVACGHGFGLTFQLLS